MLSQKLLTEEEVNFLSPQQLFCAVDNLVTFKHLSLKGSLVSTVILFVLLILLPFSIK